MRINALPNAKNMPNANHSGEPTPMQITTLANMIWIGEQILWLSKTHHELECSLVVSQRLNIYMRSQHPKTNVGGMRQRFHICKKIYNFLETYCWRYQLGHTWAMLQFYEEFYNTSEFLTKEQRQMISDWFSVYAAPSGVACICSFDWNFGLTENWWTTNPSLCTGPKRASRAILDDGQLLRATLVTISSFPHIPMSEWVPNKMPVANMLSL